MPELYTKTQVVSLLSTLSSRIANLLTPTALKAKLDQVANVNFVTDAQLTKLDGLEGSKYLGTFTTVSNIPTVGAVAGSYADVDAGAGSAAKRYIFDVDAAEFVASTGDIAGETAASVKSKYEANANTNAFTDALKTKLEDITFATDTTDGTAAIDAELS